MQKTVRTTWLQVMYTANIVLSGPIGVANVAAPEAMRGILGIPPGDPVHYGMATGAVPLAFGIAGVLGLFFPLRFSPILLLQVLYKSLFLLGVVLPLAVAGTVPGFAIPLTPLFLFFIVGDVIAVPFPYLVSKPTTSS